MARVSGFQDVGDEHCLSWRNALTFPRVVEAEFLCPDTDHAPGVEQDDANGHCIEHGLRRKTEALLNLPEGKNANGLSSYANNEKVRKIQGVVRHDRILESADDGDGRIKRVTEQEVS